MKIKFSTLLMSLPLMAAVTSCSEGDIAEVESSIAGSNSYIGFNVQTQRTTRGPVQTSATLNQKDQKFNIYSVYTQDKTWQQCIDENKFPVKPKGDKVNPFNEETVIKYDEKTKWNATELKLWPENGKTTFIAYWPITDTSPFIAATETKAPYLYLSLSSDYRYNYDYLAATAVDKSKTSNEGKLDIQFHHIMSRVEFAIKLEEDIDPAEWGKTTLKIKGLRFEGTKSKGMPSYGYYVFKPTADGKPGVWERPYHSDYNYDMSSYMKPFVKYYKTKGGTEEKVADIGDLTSTAYTKLFDADKYMFLIPPSNEGITETTGPVVVELEYFLAFSEEGQDEHARIERKSHVSLPMGTLQPGKAYRFNLTINPVENLVQIDTDLVVDDWGTVTPIYAEATALTVADIKTAWEELASQSHNADDKYTWYRLHVGEPKPNAEIDLTTVAKTFKNASTAIELIFSDRGLYTTDATNLKLPAGYYLDTTVSNKNLIRYSEAKKDEASKP